MSANNMQLAAFQRLTKGYGVEVLLPSGAATHGLFDEVTKPESLSGMETQIVIGQPSVVLAERLEMRDMLTIGGKTYRVSSYETDPDGLLTRYSLAPNARGQSSEFRG
jgi:hypothetical protein